MIEFGEDFRLAAFSLQETEKLLARDSGVGEDAAEGPALHILCVDRNRDDVPALRMREVVMTAFRASQLPALLLKDSDQLPGTYRRKSFAHAATTVTRSISAGWGSGRPSSVSTSR